MDKSIFRNSIYIIAFLASTFIISCKPDSYYKYDIQLDIVAWSMPDTVNVSQDFNIYLKTQSFSSCTKKHDFAIIQVNNNTFEVYGTAIHESYNGNCTEKFVEVDTTISGHIEVVGRFYFLFLYDQYWKVDSIQVVP